jgi:transcriptional regulator with XRE-family HTH domain
VTTQDKPAAPAKLHLGAIARDLREAAGMTRRVFGDAVGLGEAQIKSFEFGRLRLGVESLQRVLRHPAMADLPKLAHAAGIEPQGGEGGGVEGDKP